MSAGVSSPVWLATKFLQPLATNHTSQHTATINEINNQIQQSSVYSCGSCQLPIKPAATNPKDQELSCNRCESLFHKKCTDRKKTTANWRRSPWYCSNCIGGSQASVLPSGTQPPPGISGPSSLNSSAREFIPNFLPAIDQHQAPQTSFQNVAHPAALYSDTTRSPAISDSGIASVPASDNATVSDPSHVPHASVAPVMPGVIQTSARCTPINDSQQVNPPVPEPLHDVQPRYPTTTTRQRSSNINVGNAELEFQRTALTALRSTVTQQEAEIKRLNECMEIRNKRVVQLESQVGHASDLLADRNAPNELPNAALKALADKVDGILVRLERLQTSHPSNNIVINSCHADHSQQGQNTSTQTEADLPPDEDAHSNSGNFSCNTCRKICTTSDDLQKHVTDEHSNPAHIEQPSPTL